MAHRRLRRSVLILVLFTLLAAPWDSGAATGPEPVSATAPAERPAEFLGRLWSRLVDLWGAEGCHIDPYGRCSAGPGTQAAQVSRDKGCIIDPYGACRPGS